jgi:hypothetical protein
MKPVPLIEAEPDQCRWIISDGSPWLVCGERCSPVTSWCETHKRIAFVPVKKRELVEP